MEEIVKEKSNLCIKWLNVKQEDIWKYNEKKNDETKILKQNKKMCDKKFKEIED